MAWKVQINDDQEEIIKNVIKNLSSEEQTIIYKWVKFVEKNGPYALSNFKAYDIKDHELTRQKKWENCYSCSFSYSGRIIYKIMDDIILVEVIRITPNHDYS